MDDGLLSLKWNNHKSTFFEILKLLRDKANFTDATLAVDGKFYPVHKLVLSTCSEYFSEIFERTPCTSPVIVLKDVRSQDLESLLDYMYLGEVNVNQNDLALLLKTAECLRIKGLAVPDEDPTKQSDFTTKKHIFDGADCLKDIPPSKRRKEDPSSLSPSRISTSSRVSSPLPLSSQTNILDPKTIPLVSEDNPVKFERETEEDAYASESNLENDIDCDKSEPDTAGLSNFTASISQQDNNLTWEDREDSFHQESFSDPSNQQGEMCASMGFSHSVPSSLSPVSGIKEYRRQCHICGKGFDQPYNLQRHIRIHTGERPFPCLYCTYAASEKSHLKSHVARKHQPQFMSWNVSS